MYHISQKTQGFYKNIKSRTRFSSLSLSLSLSLLLVAVFATSLFFVPKPSVAATSNDDAIVLSGDTVIIQGDCDTRQIHSFMNNQGAQDSVAKVGVRST